MVATSWTLLVVPVGEDGDVLPEAEDTGAAEGVEEAGPWTGEAGEESDWLVTDGGEETLWFLVLGGRLACGSEVLPTVLVNWPEEQLTLPTLHGVVVTVATEPVEVVGGLAGWVGTRFPVGLAPEVAAVVVFCWVVLVDATGVVVELVKGWT